MTDSNVVVRISRSSCGLSCITGYGRSCQFLCEQSHNYCSLFNDGHGDPVLLASDANAVILRCRQCHEAEARLRAELNVSKAQVYPGEWVPGDK